MSKGNIVTFYSYKGGIGRTFALANVGVVLSLWGYKVLCVDWDLEAPGLDSYFKGWMDDSKNPGLTELIHNFKSAKGRKRLDWRSHLTALEISSKTPPFHLIMAGVQDETYIDRVQQLDWEALYEKKNLGASIETMRDEWKDSYDFILVDSRTGITDIGGICTVQLPDILVGMFTANAQSLNGVKYVLKRAQVHHNNYPYSRVNLKALPIASRFNEEVQFAFAQEWIQKFADNMQPFYADWLPESISAATLVKHTTIKSRPYWSFGERLPVIESGTINPADIGYTFENLAALLAHKLTGADRFIKNRKAYIRDVAKNSISKPTDLSIDFKNVDRLVKDNEIVLAVALAKIYLDAHDYDTAIKVLQYILSRMSGTERDYYIPLGNLGYAFNYNGDYKAANETLNKVRKYKRGKFFFPWHAVALAYSYFKLGDKGEYRKWLKQAKENPMYRGKIQEFKKLYPEIKADI